MLKVNIRHYVKSKYTPIMPLESKYTPLCKCKYTPLC